MAGKRARSTAEGTTEMGRCRLEGIGWCVRRLRLEWRSGDASGDRADDEIKMSVRAFSESVPIVETISRMRRAASVVQIISLPWSRG